MERQYEPSGGHFAVSQMAAAPHSQIRVITQNIDGLHGRSGLADDRLIEVHGRAGLFKCVTPRCRFAEAESIHGGALDLVPAAAAPAGDGGDNGGGGGGGGGGAATVLGALPRCPACDAPSPPQALLFDEEYESHSFYQYRKARRWLQGAKAIVFVGTSFAVGVTEHALQIAEEGALPTFSFNVTDIDPAQHGAASSYEGSLPSPVMHHIIGGCEATLPRLAALVAAPVATKTSLWYAGHIPPEAEAAALEGLGTAWNERTTGDGRKMRSRGKKRDRQPAVSKHETTWVACDKCGKWRKLPPGVRLPEEQASSKWQCKQNVWDKKRAKCSAAEEPWA